MAKCVTFLGCILLVVSLILHECAAEWGTQEDRDLVLQTFDLDTDPCTKIFRELNTDERAAADDNCWKSFKALDAIRMNTCGGWISAKCRTADGSPEERCSCTFSIRQVRSSVNSFESFRHCAWNFGSRVPKGTEKTTEKKSDRGSSSDAAVEPPPLFCSFCKVNFESPFQYAIHADVHPQIGLKGGPRNLSAVIAGLNHKEPKGTGHGNLSAGTAGLNLKELKDIGRGNVPAVTAGLNLKELKDPKIL